MKILLASTTALLLTVAPAYAQVIGGGSLGGTLGSTLNGPGSLGSTMDTVRSPVDTMDTVDTAARGNARSDARTAGTQSVNAKSGAVRADRSANADLTGTAAQAVATPAQSLTASGSGRASGRVGGSADARLVGSDGLSQTATGTLSTVRSTASGAATSARNGADMLGSSARQTAGSGQGAAAGTVSGSATGMLSGASGNLAAAGTLVAAGNGAFAVRRGMTVLGPDGNRLGKVRSVIVDTRGEVQAVLVKVDGATTTLPAANFSGEGSALVSAMGKSQIRQQQAGAKRAAPKPASPVRATRRN